MQNEPDSRYRESLPRNGSALARLAAAALLAVNLAAHAAPTVEEDYAAGLRAYKLGDMVAATTVLRRAADTGHAPSQALYASILDDAEFNEEAVQWFRKAADQGNADGEFGLGRMYLAGEGVTRDGDRAFALLTRAGDKGHASAIRALAGGYTQALRGESVAGLDLARAAEWLRKAADLNDLPATETLAAAYRDGGLGIKPDAAEAARYAAQAAALRKKMSPPTTGTQKKKPRV